MRFFGLLSLLILLLLPLLTGAQMQDQQTTPTPLISAPNNSTQPPLIGPPPTRTPTATITLTPTASFTPTIIPTNTLRPTSTPAEFWGDHYWMTRPFEPDPTGRIKDYPARGYAYGSMAGGGLAVHHGIDIENPNGTRIVAVDSGTVFYAGSDFSVAFGPRTNFYGNVVVIQHDRPAPDGRALYSLYGHVSEFFVETGQIVQRGDFIAAVGAEGVALGPHLHLEVRVGSATDYYATYNPELWIEPWQNHGVFAARVVGRDGEHAAGLRLELIGQRRYFMGWTYTTDTVNSDPFFDENIVIGDMPAGQYDLIIGEARNTIYRDTVVIEPGVTTLYEFQVPFSSD